MAKKDVSYKVNSKEVLKKKKKFDGGFQHSTRNLKRIAQMPEKDRMKILRILKMQSKNRKARLAARSTKEKSMDAAFNSKVSSNFSFSSVNNDWEHWVSFKGEKRLQWLMCWNKIRLTNITLRVGEIVGTKNV